MLLVRLGGKRIFGKYTSFDIVLAALLGSIHSKRLGHAIKGVEARLVEGDPIDWQAMRKHHVTEHDLLEAVRVKSGTEDIRDVRAAYLARNARYQRAHPVSTRRDGSTSPSPAPQRALTPAFQARPAQVFIKVEPCS